MLIFSFHILPYQDFQKQDLKIRKPTSSIKFNMVEHREFVILRAELEQFRSRSLCSLQAVFELCLMKNCNKDA